MLLAIINRNLIIYFCNNILYMYHIFVNRSQIIVKRNEKTHYYFVFNCDFYTVIIFFQIYGRSRFVFG